MRKLLFIVGTIIALCGAGAGAGVGGGRAEAAGLAGRAGRAATTASVSIRGRQYAPATIRIAAGDSVRWTNDDECDHTVVADDGSFSSGNMKPGQSFEHRFGQKGTFGYGCRMHPREKGRVVVE